jgi:hypothetical protein
MRSRKTINLAVPADLAEQFDAICGVYGHGKQKGLVLAAAMLMFLEAHPEAQGEAIERVFQADVAQGVKQMLDRARAEQQQRIAAKKHRPDAKRPTPRDP